MPHYLPSDFEIDTDTRTVTQQAANQRVGCAEALKRSDLPAYAGTAAPVARAVN